MPPRGPTARQVRSAPRNLAAASDPCASAFGVRHHPLGDVIMHLATASWRRVIAEQPPIQQRGRFARENSDACGGRSVSVFPFSLSSDGLCATMSQSHPHTPGAGGRPTRLPDDVSEMKAGVWSVAFHNHDHMGIVPLPSSSKVQRNFFSSLFSRLRALPLPPYESLHTAKAANSCSSILPRAHSLSNLSDASTCVQGCGGCGPKGRFGGNNKSFGSLAESSSSGSLRALSGLGSSNSLRGMEGGEGSCASLTLLEPRAGDEAGLPVVASPITA